MKRSHNWFTDRAEAIWKATPGRSITCLVPAGCSEISGFSAFLEQWLLTGFKMPSPIHDHRLIVMRLVPDHSTSAAKFVERIRHKAISATGKSFAQSDNLDPGEALDTLVAELATTGFYVLFIIERFQSFARFSDHATLSLLSQLRSLEHDFAVTSILVSTQSCSVIRARLASGAAFVNSAYGDNHDHAVMSVLSLSEFSASFPNISSETIDRAYSIGAGPDSVFQALVDELPMGADSLSERSWARSKQILSSFVTDLFGQCGAPEISLFKAAIDGDLNMSQVAYLRSLPHAAFFFEFSSSGQVTFKGELASTFARWVTEGFDGPQSQEVRLLICSANPDFDLDLEREIRRIQEEARVARFHSRIIIESSVATTPDDFLAVVRRFKPTAIHFSGHGCADGIIMRGEGQATHVVSGAALAQTLTGRGVQLLVLNSCSSKSQADAAAFAVSTIIGTTEEVQDDAALRFSGAFYRALLNGETISAALKDGRDVLALYNLYDVYEHRGRLDRPLI